MVVGVATALHVFFGGGPQNWGGGSSIITGKLGGGGGGGSLPPLQLITVLHNKPLSAKERIPHTLPYSAMDIFHTTKSSSHYKTAGWPYKINPVHHLKRDS